MIYQDAQLAVTHNSRLLGLQRQYRDICFSHDSGDQVQLPHAATFVPADGDGVAFSRAIARIGSVQFCALEQDIQQPRSAASRLVYRGYRARYVAETGETDWEQMDDWFDFELTPDGYESAGNVRLANDSKLLNTMIGLHCAANRVARRGVKAGQHLVLPPTLLGFAADTRQLQKRCLMKPTRWVCSYAADYGVSIRKAWRELYGATRYHYDESDVDLRLFDARLCVDSSTGYSHLPEIGAMFHDLRPLLGRHVTNPASRIAELTHPNPAPDVIGEVNAKRGVDCDPGQWSQAEADRAMEMMRERIGPKNIFFSDFDLSTGLVVRDMPVRIRDFDPEQILQQHDTTAIARGMRRMIAPNISGGVSNRDLITGFHNPDRPLVASRVASNQVW